MDASSGLVRDDGRVARRRGRYVALAVGLVLACSGCGAESPDSPPSGIDELTIPTPSPDPADFVRGIDNPWLALAPGRTWTYRVTGATSGQLVITVEDTTFDVAGVATTPVRRTEPTGDEVVDYYAQDRLGNVWWFGREGVWLAGEDGAEAGLAMPATPRLGDGWRAAYDADVVDVQMTVVTDDQSVTTPAGRYSHVVGLDISYPLEPGTAKRVFFERGLGLVEEISTDGPIYLADLLSPPS
ncbi:MAG: hypothetical protein QOD98_3765 [Nocardioidaceae bacterium]|nr:hypothetical protein [Nocardioidaceae bacterium]